MSNPALTILLLLVSTTAVQLLVHFVVFDMRRPKRTSLPKARVVRK